MTTLFSEEQQNLLMNIGAVLLICQAMEPLLDSFCELASASVVTLDLLEGLDAETAEVTANPPTERRSVYHLRAGQA